MYKEYIQNIFRNSFKISFNKILCSFIILIIFICNSLYGIIFNTKYSEENLEFEFINSFDFSCNTFFKGPLTIISLNEIKISKANLEYLKKSLSEDKNIEKFAFNYNNENTDLFIQLYNNIKNIKKTKSSEKISKAILNNTTYYQYLANNPLIIFFIFDSVQDSITLITNDISGKFDSNLLLSWKFFEFYHLCYGDRARAVRKDIGFPEKVNTRTFIWNYRKQFAQILKKTSLSNNYLKESNILLINLSSPKYTDIFSNISISDSSSNFTMNVYHTKILIEFGEKAEGNIFPETHIFSKINKNLDIGKLSLAKKQLENLEDNISQYGIDFLYGKYYYLTDNYEYALTYLNKAVINNIYVVQSLQILAMIYKKKNELEKCELTYTALLKIIYSNESLPIIPNNESVSNLPFLKNIFSFIQKLLNTINYIYLISVGTVFLIVVIFIVLKKFFNINFITILSKSKEQEPEDKKMKKSKEKKSKKKESDSTELPKIKFKKTKTDSTETPKEKSKEKNKDKQIEKSEEKKEDIKKAILEYNNQGLSTQVIAEKLNIGVEEVRLVLQFNKSVKE